MSILDTLFSWKKTLPFLPPSLLVGFSGGRDSHVLLHALHQCQFSFRAIHINHGLRPDAGRWVEHCQAICDALCVPLSVHTLGLSPTVGESVENIARQARYKAFSEVLRQDEVLVTAHHLDDQAETVLLQLLRGSGPKGLAAMPALKPFHQGWHARPFLEVSRTQIDNYAKAHSLQWIEDDSNDDVRYTRNFLRHKIMNHLSLINPSYAECLARTAKHCAQSQALLESYLANDLLCCQTPKGLCVTTLKQYDFLRQQGIVRLWLQNEGYPLPSTKKLKEIVQQMVHARLDSKPCVEWGPWQAQRIKGEVVIAKREKWTV